MTTERKDPFEGMNNFINSKVSPFFNRIDRWQDEASIFLYVINLKIQLAPVAVHGPDPRLTESERKRAGKREAELVTSVTRSVESKLKFGMNKVLAVQYDFDARQYLHSIAQALLRQASKPSNENLRESLYLTLRSILLKVHEISKKYENVSDKWQLLPEIARLLVGQVSNDSVSEKLSEFASRE